MSITVSYRRISEEKLKELLNNPEKAEEFFYGGATAGLLDKMMQAQNDPEMMKQLREEAFKALYQDKISVYVHDLDKTATQLSIEKEWQAIHYLLTGEIAFDESHADPPLSYVVMGGTPTQYEASYGYIRYLMPEEVKEISLALNKVSKDDLRARFDARGDADIYAHDDWDEEVWETLKLTFDHIVKFFNEASSHNEVILIAAE